MIARRRFGITAAAIVAVSVALSASAQSEVSKLAAKAKGYADKTLNEFHIDPTDGIDLAEAKLIADWVVLGAVDVNGNPAKILSYTEPVSDGWYWRVDVTQEAAVPPGSRRGRLFISKVSGRSFGAGWFSGVTIGGPSIDLSKAEFIVHDSSGPPEVRVTLKRLVRPNDAVARADIEASANQVVALFNAKTNGCVERIEPADVKISESEVTDQFDRPDRQWHAWIVLRPKKNPP